MKSRPMMTAVIAFFFSLSLALAVAPASWAQAPVFVLKWGSLGSNDGEFLQPYDVDADANGDVYVVEFGHNRVQKFGLIPIPTKATSWGRLKGLYR